MSVVLLDGEMVHYEVLGRGRPIIFLHGWVGSWRYWISSMQVASTSFRSYAIDLWGFGETSRNPTKYTLENQVTLLDDFLKKMGIGKIALVGHGLGAMVAFSFSNRWPQLVDRVMAINCPLEFSDVNARLYTTAMTDLEEWLSSKTPEADIALVDVPKTDPQVVQASMSGLQANNLFSYFRQSNIPCLLVNGLNDPAIIHPPMEMIASLPINVHQIILESSGHFPMIDETVKFNRLLTDFLALESGISPRELQLKEEWKRRVR
ncbi:MAG: alpha/beta hydrolase [Anaerolineales bacterium]|nr:alpha/beta hydrolase [Anaerolineales bacterium]